MNVFILKGMTLTPQIICCESRYIITVEDAGVFAFMGYFKQREKNHKRRI